MPTRPPRPCSWPGGCPELVDVGYCTHHQRRERQQQDQRRGSAASRGYDSKWAKARKLFLTAHPLCVMECKEQGRITAAVVVDHIVPHKGDQKLFWDRKNWQSGCKTCHDRKTARDDGGFGNRRMA